MSSITDVPLSEPSSPALSLRLFGPFAASLDGQPLPRLRSRKEQHLLVLLALRAPRPAERVWLAGTLWPDSTEDASLSNLRRSLHLLRSALGTQGARLISPAPGTVALDVAGADIDVQSFDAALHTSTPDSLETALALAARPLLEDSTEDWALAERAARQEALLSACEACGARCAALGEHARAARLLRPALALDPLRESLVRALMQSLAATGDTAGAMDAFRRFRRRLRRELDAAPASETQALLGTILETLSPAPASARHLPRPLTALIGRRRELAAAVAALDTSRLVTLTGTGGVGKTRLAIAVAQDLSEETEVCFAPLAALTDAASLAATVGRALEIDGPCETAEALVGHLRGRSLLLVLDNCEHLVDGCAAFAAAVLEGCPRLRVLATSRQALGVPGEAVRLVPLLSVPPEEDAPSAGMKPETEYEAVQLFVARARAARPSFSAHPQTLPAVARICRRLDGLPLAIELAAARVRSLSCDQIAQRLDRRFALLTDGNRGALPRHQTLRAAVDWSYDLLTEAERLLLGRLSVFAGGWTLEAAEAVCGAGGIDISEALPGLVDKSLVQMQASEDGTVRYVLLETLREYGQEKLTHVGEADVLRARHGLCFLGLAEDAAPLLTGPEQAAGLARLETEHDNLRAALEWGFVSGDMEGVLRLTGALWPFWYVRGYVREGLAWMERALQGAADTPSRPLLKVLNGAGALAYVQGEASARAYLEKGEAYSRQIGDRESQADALINLGNLFYSAQDFPAARAYYTESLALFREVGDRRGVARTLVNLGLIYMEQEEYARAQAHYEEGLSLFRLLGDKQGMANALVNLGIMAQDRQDLVQAHLRYGEAVDVCRELNSPVGFVYALDGMANVAGAQGRAERAGRLWGAVEAMREAMDMRLPPEDEEDHRRHVAAARMQIGAEAFAAAWEQGRAMTMEQAIAYARQAVPSGPEAASAV